jgi:hypothetical protein
MNCNRRFLGVLVMVLAPSVMAQHNKPAGGRPAGGGVRPGQTHPGQQHMMTPEQQMEYEFYRQQMMLNEMMRPRGGGRGQGQASSGRGQRQSGGNSTNSSSNGMQQRGQGHSGSRSPNSAKAAEAGSLGSNGEQSSPKNGKKGKTNDATNRLNEERKERERAKEKSHEDKEAIRNRSTRIVDNRAVSMLKTVHNRLREADADYQGHRVKAMNHIATAIRHLGSAAGVNMGSMLAGSGIEGLGTGHLSQGASDEILHNAIVQLKGTQGSLGTGPAAAAHHLSAHTSITEAVRELEVALKIR